MNNKEIILAEFKKAAETLKSKGVDMTGTYFGCKNEYSNSEHAEAALIDKIPWEVDGSFTKVVDVEICNLALRLTGAETALVFLLMPKIAYETGMLTKGGGVPVTMADIERMSNLSMRTVIKCMDGLVSKRVYARSKVGREYRYFANPYIFFKGKYVSRTLIAMFKDYKKVD
jgi:hypothetical protein